MLHKMNLTPTAFEAVRSGKKTVEMRLYDEKRKRLSVGDDIEFTNSETEREIKCAVVGLTRFKDFFELYNRFNKTTLGYAETDTANAEDMYTYYSAEQIEAFGVLAIEIKLKDK